jgi:hypothetical protein
MQQQQPIGILLISTGKYKQFVRPFIESLDNHFLKTKNLKVYLFTDEEFYIQGYDRIKVKQIIIPSYRFPYASLYRYKIFTGRSYSSSHLFYFDVDMKIVADIGEEFLKDLIAVRHPGFDKVGGGSWETNVYSACFTADKKTYYAGGVQGGRTSVYYPAMQKMKGMIDKDQDNGIMPRWHDESAWNCYLSKIDNFKELDSSYCMVEQMDLRKKWKIDQLQPKIIALEKNHELIRK